MFCICFEPPDLFANHKLASQVKPTVNDLQVKSSLHSMTSKSSLESSIWILSEVASHENEWLESKKSGCHYTWCQPTHNQSHSYIKWYLCVVHHPRIVQDGGGVAQVIGQKGCVWLFVLLCRHLIRLQGMHISNVPFYIYFLTLIKSWGLLSMSLQSVLKQSKYTMT